MKKLLIGFLALFLLTACNTSSMLELIYFSRVKFTFTNDKEEQFTYLCSKSKTKGKTRERADEAHKYMSAKLDEISQEYVDTLFSVDSSVEDKNSDIIFEDAAIKLTSKTEKLAHELDSKFHCLLIDSKDLGENK